MEIITTKTVVRFHVHDRDAILDAQECFSEDGSQIRYKPLLSFIQETMIPRLCSEMNWSTCIWSKLRISDNNNSTDASAFHRDLISYDDNERKAPIYTCLCYLDEGTMEFIHDSYQEYETSNFLTSWNQKKQQIHFSPGDIVVFRSSTLHRGVFRNKGQKHRRLIQLFECFGSQPDFQLYFPKILFVPARSNHGQQIKSLTSSQTLFFPMVNFIAYMNALSGYNQKHVKNWLCVYYPDCSFISSDAEQQQWDFNWENEIQPTNLYIYSFPYIGARCTNHHVFLNEEHHKPLKRLQYVYPLVYYTFGVLLCFLFVVCCGWFVIMKLLKKLKKLKHKNKGI